MSTTAQQDGPEQRGYRIVRSPYFTRAQLALAPRQTRIEDAVAGMGDGLVIRDDGVLAAFHERHERFVAALCTPASG